MKQRLYSLDFLKFAAALMITNSHFQPLYENVSKSLATFGVHGNALFFFVSGFLLMMGFERHKNMGFIDWYKARVRRLWPSVFVWTIIAAVVWHAPLTVGKLVLASDYWFLQAIAVNYLAFYLCFRQLPKFIGGGKEWWLFALSVTASVACFFLMPMSDGSPFHTSLHYVCHFSIMVLGAIVYKFRGEISTGRQWWDGAMLVVSFVAYFLILAIGKGRTDCRYYVQILALLPLHAFVFYAFKVASLRWVDKCFKMRGVGGVVSFIANLTLEIYVVQFMIITNRFNWLFPLNVVLVFMLITFAAYMLKVLTSMFLAVLSKDAFNYKEIIHVE